MQDWKAKTPHFSQNLQHDQNGLFLNTCNLLCRKAVQLSSQVGGAAFSKGLRTYLKTKVLVEATDPLLNPPPSELASRSHI